MSKAVKKVFKTVKKTVKKVGSFVKKHWKTIALVAATVFTAGAALGYVGMGAGGGLAFGAGAGVGGMTGVTTAFGALGNTVMGAVGLGSPFGGTVTAKSSSVMGLGTGGLKTASGKALASGTTTKFGGGSILKSGSMQSAASAPASAGVPGSAPATAAKGGAQGATAGPGQSMTINNGMPGAPAPKTPGLLQPAGPGVNQVASGAGNVGAEVGAKAGMSMGEKMMLGGMAVQGAGAYLSGKAEEEALKAERERMRWDYGEVDPELYPNAAGMANVNHRTSRPQPGLLVPQTARPGPRMTTMDELAAARYG